MGRLLAACSRLVCGRKEGGINIIFILLQLVLLFDTFGAGVVGLVYGKLSVLIPCRGYGEQFSSWFRYSTPSVLVLWVLSRAS